MKKKFGLLCATALLGATFLHTVHADANADAFKKLDKDNNGFITKAESEASSSIAEAFDDSDSNGDNKLDLTEFSSLEISND